jgi:putative heme-binding domain-containing protein
LDNIVDPSNVVSTDYRMNVIELKDGRVLSGMISGQDRNSLTLRMPGSEILVSKSDIKKKQVLNTSIMPAGLLDNIGPDERRNLIGYLMHPQQVP